ncbi:deoxyribonucleoside 5'-monophosphate N-glycosidase [Methanococcoides orientis]|uniref:nucleoside 2-deoxyribosyltransferase n=1 Tax=Methanococcoides orientis TaxID=2822137 RepID=UPI001E45F1F8|nr:nucleoside 2-deoxyribosyltransferase [Methanococcoides orientis]UGV40487.1 deoxyribonucleoside 5'-monophosphate N-glycosidase [Methanococcoides orientis]
MKIFLSGSIRGGRQMLPTYQFICGYLRNNGHEVLSWHVAHDGVEATESLMSESQIYERDMGFLRTSECMIAEVSLASTGVGYEVCSAINKAIPILCVHKPDSNVSAMILGNTNCNVTVKEYSGNEDLEVILREFLSSF